MTRRRISDEDFIRVVTAARTAHPPKNYADIARDLKVNKRTLERRLARLREKGAPVPAPLAVTRWNELKTSAVTVPAPYELTGQTILRKQEEDGTVRNLMWYDMVRKTKDDWTKNVEEFARGLSEKYKATSQVVARPSKCDAELANIFPFGDPHVGLYCWSQEAGDSFDLKIAEDIMLAALTRLVQQVPKAEEAWLISLGDYFHADDQSNATPAHKNSLDVDSRWPKIQQAGGRIMRRMIDMLLSTHRKVVVRCVRGNHDPHASFTLAMLLAAVYENNPRVEVSLDPQQHWYRAWGASLYGVTHGHNVKRLEVLPALMATDRPHLWATSRYRHWLLGHYHKSFVAVDETCGATVEIFRTLAPSDAWAQGLGYRSMRSLDAITVHKEHGEIIRHRVYNYSLNKGASSVDRGHD